MLPGIHPPYLVEIRQLGGRPSRRVLPELLPEVFHPRLVGKGGSNLSRGGQHREPEGKLLRERTRGLRFNANLHLNHGHTEGDSTPQHSSSSATSRNSSPNLRSATAGTKVHAYHRVPTLLSLF